MLSVRLDFFGFSKYLAATSCSMQFTITISLASRNEYKHYLLNIANKKFAKLNTFPTFIKKKTLCNFQALEKSNFGHTISFVCTR